MNPFGNLSHPPKSLKPVEEMLPQELMHLIVILKPSTALLDVIDPVETSILNLRRKALHHSTALYLSSKVPRRVHATDVLFEGCRHEPYTAVG